MSEDGLALLIEPEREWMIESDIEAREDIRDDVEGDEEAESNTQFSFREYLTDLRVRSATLYSTDKKKVAYHVSLSYYRFLTKY